MSSNRHKSAVESDGSRSPGQAGGAAGGAAGSRPAIGNDDVLDAARDCVLAVGVRRTTLTDVARRAGVSRMTIYRRWPDVRTLVGDLMTREWVAAASAAAHAVSGPDPVTAASLESLDTSRTRDTTDPPDGLSSADLEMSVVSAAVESTLISRSARQGDDGEAARPVRDRLVGELVAAARAIRDDPLMRKIIDVDPELLLPYVLDRRGTSQNAFLQAIEASLRKGRADGSIRTGHIARQARTVLLTVQAFTFSLRTMTDDSDPDLDASAFEGELRRLLDGMLRP